MPQSEIYVSVDVETSGPVPGIFSLLSVGACLVHDPAASLYLELKPDSAQHDPESLRVTGFDLSQLEQNGLPPQEAMLRFKEWIDSFILPGKKVIFVGLNAPFDWSFINYYFVKYIGSNPFGFTAIDMKAYFMGARGCTWSETKSSHMASLLTPGSQPTHNALDDARFQAELFSLMLIKENLYFD
ncbi:MAG TPA: 3'-5' exonuclease [Scandinavium sp.]|jgi:DNA polymerase III epsilon subunit-like protein